MKIITNNVPRTLIFGFDLTAKERKEFDYLTDDEINDQSFFRYKGAVYHLGDIQRVERLPEDSPLNRWHGFAGDSFFSGIVIRLVNDDQIIIGRYVA